MNIITELTVKRLFNLGNYEHESIEVHIARQFGILNPVETIQKTRVALNACKPAEVGWEAEQGIGIEVGTIDKTQFDESQLCEFELAKNQYRADLVLREQQIAFLDTLGTVTRKGVEA